MNTLTDRFHKLPAPSPAEALHARLGTRADYKQLAGFHYLANAPFSIERVLVLEDRRPTVAARFNPQSTIRNSKCIVGVLIESLPALSCVLRDQALGGRYRWDDRGAAARLLNREVRCISRVVVHPQWRGLGLAVRLVRWALDTATTPYTEALAAMGRVHPFFERAGMTAYRRWPLAKDQRLLDALRYAGLEPWALARVDAMTKRLENPDDSLRSLRPRSGQASSGLLRRELRRWAGGRLTLRQQLELARDRLLCEPVYYLHGPRG